MIVVIVAIVVIVVVVDVPGVIICGVIVVDTDTDIPTDVDTDEVAICVVKINSSSLPCTTVSVYALTALAILQFCPTLNLPAGEFGDNLKTRPSLPLFIRIPCKAGIQRCVCARFICANIARAFPTGYYDGKGAGGKFKFEFEFFHNGGNGNNAN